MSDTAIGVPTRLFSLAPIGAGTAAGESLLSYLVRLARAHSMSPRQLIRSEVLPHADLGGGPACGRFYADQARTMTGVGKYARAFVRVLQGLTGRDDLAVLTMLPWANIMPPVGFGLIADQVRWCPDCLVAQRSSGADHHFPLIWSLDCYQACPRHGRPLACSCPWCGCTQHAVSDYPDQHRCTHCRGYLGSKREGADLTVLPSERQLHRAFLIEDMLASSNGAEAWATHANLCRRLIALADAWTDGEKRTLSLRLGLTKTSVSTWVAKGQRPVFPQLLQLCEATSLSVRALLEKVDGPQPPITAIPRCVEVSARHIHSEAERNGIEAVLAQMRAEAGALLSAASAAAAAGVTVAQLRYRYRSAMVELSVRYQAQRNAAARHRWAERLQTVATVARGLAVEGINPSRRRMTEQLRRLRLSLKNPRLRQAYREVLTADGARSGQ